MNVLPSLNIGGFCTLYSVLPLGAVFAVSMTPVATAAPTVADDDFNVVEDQPFTAAAGSIFESDFDGGSPNSADPLLA